MENDCTVVHALWSRIVIVIMSTLCGRPLMILITDQYYKSYHTSNRQYSKSNVLQ